jgi:hypothetical protein
VKNIWNWDSSPLFEEEIDQFGSSMSRRGEETCCSCPQDYQVNNSEESSSEGIVDEHTTANSDSHPNQLCSMQDQSHQSCFHPCHLTHREMKDGENYNSRHGCGKRRPCSGSSEKDSDCKQRGLGYHQIRFDVTRRGYDSLGRKEERIAVVFDSMGDGVRVLLEMLAVVVHSLGTIVCEVGNLSHPEVVVDTVTEAAETGGAEVVAPSNKHHLHSQTEVERHEGHEIELIEREHHHLDH